MNKPHATTVANYQHEGNMRYEFSDATTRTYTPNSYGGPAAEPARAGEGSWESDGTLTRAAATLHSEDDDFGQAGTLYREVFDAESKARLLETLTGQGKGITVPEIRERFFWYWGNVDADLGASLRTTVGAL